MDRISDDRLGIWIDWTGSRPSYYKELNLALVELRERRAAERVTKKSVQEQWCGTEKD